MIVKNVIDWVNADGRPLWWRHAARVAIGHGNIIEQYKDVLYNIAKIEVGLIPPDAIHAANISQVLDTGFTIENAPVNLIAIANVKNIATLVENQSITFNSSVNLSVVYGNNGSGKSSYAKILKNACLTRGDVPEIISNVYKAKTGISSAEITVQVGNDPVKIETWIKGSIPSSELKSIRVFDSNSANHYLSKEDNIEYKPAGLKILDELIIACNYVSKRCVQDIQGLGNKAVFPTLPFGSSVSEFLQKISKDTTPKNLQANCASQSEIDNLTQLRKDLVELQANTPVDLRNKYKEKYQRLEPMIKHFDDLDSILGDTSVLSILKLFNSMKTTEAAAVVSRQLALDDLPIDGIASQPWIKMWEHVEAFIKSNGQSNSFPPIEGEYCPTCVQPITQSAAEQLKVFNNYLKDKTQSEASSAKKLFESAINKLKLLSFDLSAHDGVLKWIEAYNSEFAQVLKKFNSDLEKRRISIVKINPTFIFPAFDLRAYSWLTKQVTSLKQKEIDIKDDVSKSVAIAKLQNVILDIEHRSKVTENKTLIQNEISRLKKQHLYNLIRSSCKISVITRKVKEIAEKGSVGELKKVFSQELNRLGFNNLDVETLTLGKLGQSTLQLKLSNNKTKIVDIASEGEQKCIALAGFLAELIVDNRKSAVIFDDPVNSLDHLWREKFANRIIEESKVRQVIVLTHDLPFMKILEVTASKYQTTIDICAIRRHGAKSGFPMKSPPWETLKTAARIGEIKNQLSQLKKLSLDSDPDPFLNLANHLYRNMRMTWERLVEEWLLKGVVERFSLDIKTQNLRYIDTIDANDNQVISDSMAKCSKFMHDNATALGVIFPNYDEIANDVNELESYFKELKKRREFKVKREPML